MRPTIKDIARQVGVSPNTVSKALNGKGRVSEATRQRILQAAQDMDYLPNQSARALARRELRIAAVYPLEPAEFYAHIARGITDQAKEMADRRCTVTTHPYPSIETPHALRQVLGAVLAERPDG
ncbi:MAG: LacI family transcriptional regulator, partial [Bifidobacteriaceae bacterium]|nr:LacI family transcriptional regulator [Bifidobacteriaceae bacterium]